VRFTLGRQRGKLQVGADVSGPVTHRRPPAPR
jgi:hypothetical protein